MLDPAVHAMHCKAKQLNMHMPVVKAEAFTTGVFIKYVPHSMLSVI